MLYEDLNACIFTSTLILHYFHHSFFFIINVRIVKFKFKFIFSFFLLLKEEKSWLIFLYNNYLKIHTYDDLSLDCSVLYRKVISIMHLSFLSILFLLFYLWMQFWLFIMAINFSAWMKTIYWQGSWCYVPL